MCTRSSLVIFNLNTISKVLERLVLVQIVSHASTPSSFHMVHSAHRRVHLTETALLKITQDILASVDDHQSFILVTLEQLVAYDSVDHKTPVSRLEYMFGVMGNALD